ncbi:MAG: hypothetical protein DLM50_02975 [Candidatus Meridianibacter frigidus]|nr:MAG: hypothetical protein DLM50_02975 [Candidatus Eremiobacteraeota bacterium]
MTGYDGPTGLGSPNGDLAFGGAPAFVRTSGANAITKPLLIRDVPSTLKGGHAVRVCANPAKGFARCHAQRLIL